MQIILLTNIKRYNYHTTIAHTIQSYLKSSQLQVTQIEINDFLYSHQCLSKINTLTPDIIITLDLAGFHLRTQSGENALNMLPTKNLNIIWGNKPEYAPLLTRKISLSMLFYDVSGTDHQLTQLYPNLLYYKSLCKLLPLPNYDADAPQNRKAFGIIWQDFMQEVLLSEA